MSVIDLKGKVALVTGSARRVGKAIALELARHGVHQVIHHAHSPAEAETTAAEVRALGVQALVVAADISHEPEIDSLFEVIDAHFGKLNVLVNSAANFNPGSFLDLSLKDWHDSLDLNLTSPFLCSQRAARLMLKAQADEDCATIINILDMSAFRPSKGYPAHTVSKAGLASLTAVMALSLAPRIRVNAIAAGMVLRDEGNSPEKWAEFGKRIPLGHTGSPSDVAQAVVFLASQPFVTGETVRVDGGDFWR